MTYYEKIFSIVDDTEDLEDIVRDIFIDIKLKSYSRRHQNHRTIVISGRRAMSFDMSTLQMITP